MNLFVSSGYLSRIPTFLIQCTLPSWIFLCVACIVDSSSFYTNYLFPQCWASRRELLEEKSKSPLFPVVATNDWCIMFCEKKTQFFSLSQGVSFVSGHPLGQKIVCLLYPYPVFFLIG